MSRPTGISPRFSITAKNFANISDALETVGHVVLENVFDQPSLLHIKKYVAAVFGAMQDRFENDTDFADSEVSEYLGGTSSFSSNPEGRKYFNFFMDMVGRSRVLDLFSFLFDGNIAAVQGPVLRRVDPNIPLRHIGLHPDVQTKNYLNPDKNEAIYTMWAPLCDIDDSTPGLLLIHRKFQFDESKFGISESEANSTILRETLEDDKNSNKIEIDIGNLHLKKQPRKILDQQEIELLDKETRQIMEELILKIGDNMYAPKLNRGSIILFRHNVIHGSFSPPEFDTLRFSVDVRFMRDFVKSDDCVVNETCCVFRQYHMRTYDPISKKLIDPETAAALKKLQDNAVRLENTIEHMASRVDNVTNSPIFRFANAFIDKIRLSKHIARRLLRLK